MSAQAHIRIIATGGTIAGRGDSPTKAAYTSAQVSADELVLAVPGLDEVAEISTETLFSLDSKEMGFSHWRSLAVLIDQRLANANCDGVVVTHGTDTLEEAAWFLDLVGRWHKPVILVGSMRAGTALSADGPSNLYQAVSVCADPAAAGRGVMVVMAADILSGWRAVKISGTALNGFHAYPGGSVGYVSGDQVFFHQGPDPGPLAGRFADLIHNERPLPLVGTQFCTAGCAQLHNLWWPQGRDAGLVVAGFGGGTVPDTMAEALRERADSGTSIVISSRVPKVMVLPETMTLVESDWVVASRYLNPQKAAVLLSLSLAAGCTPLSSFEALH